MKELYEIDYALAEWIRAEQSFMMSLVNRDSSDDELNKRDIIKNSKRLAVAELLYDLQNQ